MEAVILSKEQYDDMVMRIEEIKKVVSQNSKQTKEIFVANQELIQLMNISKCIEQTWLNKNLFILVFKIIIEVWFFA